MNLFVEERFDESIQRLALGIEPIDALRDRRVGLPLQVAIDRSPPVSPLPWVRRHDSCVFVVLYRKEINEPAPRPHLDVRITDAPHEAPMRSSRGSRPVASPLRQARRWVPRRIRYPILAENAADASPATHRIRRPSLFPGAAYDLPEATTGIRGRVLRGGKPMRWVRVQVQDQGSGRVVGRAHGDDRGEFLLALSPDAGPVGDLVDPISLRLIVFGPGAAPGPPAPPSLPAEDLLWDLPLEVAPAPGIADTVSDGVDLPPGYRASAGGPITVAFRLGRLLTTADVPFIVFT